MRERCEKGSVRKRYTVGAESSSKRHIPKARPKERDVLDRALTRPLAMK